jgi:hypothetical protein
MKILATIAIAMLVKCMQELTEQNAQMKARLDVLDKRTIIQRTALLH